jgi:hypothetical protein
MIRKFFAVLALVAAVALVASPAEAGGGGGSKKSVTMKVRNAQAATEAGVPVIYLASGAAVPADQAAFFAAGGKVVNPGQTVNFLVAPGTGTAQTVKADGTPGASAGYTAVKGKVGNALIEGTAAAPTIKGI